MSRPPAWRRATAADRPLAIVLAGGALAARALAPWAPLLSRLVPACAFHALTGLPCPGCGTTRAVLALARLDVAAAFAFNPLAALGLAGGFLVAAAALPWVALGGPLPLVRGGGLPPRLRVLAGIVLAAQWAWLVARGA